MKKIFFKKVFVWLLSLAMLVGSLSISNTRTIVVKAESPVWSCSTSVTVLIKQTQTDRSYSANNYLYFGQDNQNMSGCLPTADNNIFAYAHTPKATGDYNGYASDYVLEDHLDSAWQSTLMTPVVIDQTANDSFTGYGTFYPNATTDHEYMYNSYNTSITSYMEVYTRYNVSAKASFNIADDVSYIAGKKNTVTKDQLGTINLSYTYNGSKKTDSITNYEFDGDNTVGEEVSGVIDNKITIKYGVNNTTEKLDLTVPVQIPEGAATKAPEYSNNITYGTATTTSDLLDEATFEKNVNYVKDDTTELGVDHTVAWGQYRTTDAITYKIEYNPNITFTEDDKTYSSDSFTQLEKDKIFSEVPSYIKHAGTYKITGTACYQVKDTYNTLDTVKRTYSYDIIVDKKSLTVQDPVDYVETATPLATHVTRINVAGVNDQVVLGEYIYPNSTAVADIDTPDVKNLGWQFRFLDQGNANDYEANKASGTNGRVIFKDRELTTTDPILVTNVSLNKTSKTMYIGATTTLTATVSPSNANNKVVTWKSSNTAVATVSNGKITAKKAGIATITVTTKDGSKKATCKIIVKKRILILKGSKASAASVKLTWLKVSEASGYEIYGNIFGSSSKYITKVTSANTLTKRIRKINKKTLQRKYYKFYVKAYTTIGGKKVYLTTSNTSHVMLQNSKTHANATGVKVSTTSVRLAKGKTQTITASAITPSGTKQQHRHVAYIRYYTSDASVATVNKSGKITAKAAGTCTIYVIAVDGKYKKVSVTVK